MGLSKATESRINAILAGAAEEGRDVLYEHEVYRILGAVGLDTPQFIFVPHPQALDGSRLQRFGRHVMIKIVSPKIVHKQKLGGVRQVRNHDPLFIRFVMHQMEAEVRGRFSADNQPDIRGFLIVEQIPHTQAIGYEVLLGFKEDTAFGPVVTLSKGGDDAEFFARYYDPANLFLPHLTREEAHRMVRGLNIRHKFEAMGRTDYLNFLANAAFEISRIAYHYSFVAEPRPPFILHALEVNPFVISRDDRFIAVDGFARFSRQVDLNVPPVRQENLEAFFKPRGIAVVGVSTDRHKQNLGRTIAHLLCGMGREDIYLVNPKGGELVLGGKPLPIHRSFGEIPDPVELVVYAAPAAHAPAFLRSVPPESALKSLILIPGIPSETPYGDYARELEAAGAGRFRIIGPNCMGVFHAPEGPHKGINTLFLEEERLNIEYADTSNTVLLTQSGAFSVTAVDNFQQARIFKAIVSFGNKIDVKITDLMAYFAAAPDIDLISLYVEGMDPGEGRRFFDMARRIQKPIVVYKSGKTDAGARVAASHTAAISGSYDVFRAACRQAGVILVENIQDHYSTVKVFSLLASKIPASTTVAGVVNAGFESAVGADEMVLLEPARLAEATIARLKAANTHGLVDVGSAFLDLSPMADDAMYAEFVEAVLQDPGVGSVFVSVVPHTDALKTAPGTCRDPDGLARRLVSLKQRYQKPMVVSVNGGRYYQDFVAVLEENGLPVFADIRSAITSLDRFVSYFFRERATGTDCSHLATLLSRSSGNGAAP